MDYICFDCPRQCGAKRNKEISDGYCSSPYFPYIARCAPHYGEEPCISGKNGSGTIFFSGCNLKCIFCQNSQISREPFGKQVDYEDLVDIILDLQNQGVHNINFVTPTHYTSFLVEVLSMVKPKLKIPVVWNSSGYDSVSSLKKLSGLVDIYMPDFKYTNSTLSKELSKVEDYEAVASEAINEMFSQRGKYIIDDNGILKSGVLVRHLILPGYVDNTLNAIDYIADTFDDNVLFSLMSQYTPMNNMTGPLSRTVTQDENELAVHYMRQRKLSGFYQDSSSSTTEMIPDFDLTGLR